VVTAETVAMATGLDISVVLKLKTTRSKPTSTPKHSAKKKRDAATSGGDLTAGRLQQV